MKKRYKDKIYRGIYKKMGFTINDEITLDSVGLTQSNIYVSINADYHTNKVDNNYFISTNICYYLTKGKASIATVGFNCTLTSEEINDLSSNIYAKIYTKIKERYNYTNVTDD